MLYQIFTRSFIDFDLDTVKMLVNIFVSSRQETPSSKCLTIISRMPIIMAPSALQVNMLTNLNPTFLIPAADFARLWKYIAEWQGVFKHFDKDHSGSIEGRELAEAMRSFGYNLSPALLTILQHKYGNS
jgi:hypothetical protein